MKASEELALALKGWKPKDIKDLKAKLALEEQAAAESSSMSADPEPEAPDTQEEAAEDTDEKSGAESTPEETPDYKELYEKTMEELSKIKADLKTAQAFNASKDMKPQEVDPMKDLLDSFRNFS